MIKCQDFDIRSRGDNYQSFILIFETESSNPLPLHKFGARWNFTVRLPHVCIIKLDEVIPSYPRSKQEDLPLHLPSSPAGRKHFRKKLLQKQLRSKQHTYQATTPYTGIYLLECPPTSASPPPAEAAHPATSNETSPTSNPETQVSEHHTHPETAYQAETSSNENQTSRF